MESGFVDNVLVNMYNVAMKNTRGRGAHGGMNTVFRSRYRGMIGACMSTGRMVANDRRASNLRKLAKHIKACHDGVMSASCNACRELSDSGIPEGSDG